MPRKFPIALLILALSLGWFYSLHRARNPQNSTSPQPETRPAQEAPSLETSATPVPGNPQPRRATPVQSAVFIPPRPEGNIIEFEVVDGLAIAYGDVLIGKPMPGATDKRGRTEVPTPQLWDRAEIPYAINPELPNPGRVEKALDYFRKNTPVNFVPFTGQRDAIVFEPGTNHCYSSLGRVGGVQPIKLSNGCQPAEIIHEIMHALGFIHEQSRPDRDQYVQVLWQNIQDPYKAQYNVVPETFTAAIRGADFDYRSAMLYRPDTFARSPELPTMQAVGGQTIDPVREGLSEGDLKRLNKLYRFQE